MNRIILLLLCLSITYTVAGQQKGMPLNVKHQEAQAGRIAREKLMSDSVYTFHVFPGDIANNGNRAEIRFPDKFEVSHKYSYSWDFMLSGKYFQHAKLINWMIVSQWVDPPDHTRGESYKSVRGSRLSPVNLTIIRNRADGQLYLQCLYGLAKISRSVRFQLPISTDKWYHIKAQIYWSRGDDGYADFTINDSTYKITGPNKYSDMSNYWKMGLYRNKNNRDTTEAYVKNISISEIGK